MKKYFTGFLAIILAVGFSAFTKPQADQSNLNSYHWYEVNSSRTQTVGPELSYDTKIGMLQSSDCQDENELVCLVGFPTEVEPGEDITGITDAGRLINENNP